MIKGRIIFVKGCGFVLVGKNHGNNKPHNVHGNTSNKYKETQSYKEPKDGVVSGQNYSQDDQSKQLADMKKAMDAGQTKSSGEIQENISKGTASKGEQTVEIGTWNVRWLGEEPRKEEDYKKLAQVLSDSGAEVMALEEVGNKKGIEKILKYLPNFDYIMGTTGVRPGGKCQFVGFVYNKDRVQVDKSSIRELKDAQVPDLMGDDHLRAPLIVNMKADNFDFTAIALHLKSKRDENPNKPSIREEQARIVNKWVKDELAKNPEKDIIILGDCNDFPDSKAVTTLADGVMQIATDNLDHTGGLHTNIPWSSDIDQILISNGKGGAKEEFIDGSTHIVDTRKYPGYKKWGSDHNPVIASFNGTKDND